MRSRVMKALLKKELRDVMRDHKTVVMMFAVPLLLYPIIFLVAMLVMSMILTSGRGQDYRAYLKVESDDPIYAKIEEYNKKHADDEDGATHIKIIDAGEISNFKKSLSDESIDIAVIYGSKDGKDVYTLYYVSSVVNSTGCYDVFDSLIREIKDEKIEGLITSHGLDAEKVLSPVSIVPENIATKEESAGSLLGQLIPFFLITSLISGIVYPAIDTTVGEKERGTLETTFSLPVPGRDIIFSKFITITIIGVISAFLNVLSMGGMGAFMINYLSGIMDENEMNNFFAGFKWQNFIPSLLLIMLVTLSFSLFLSAVSMCITSLAKSQKEANNYITPLTLIVIMTGYLGFIPNLKLTKGLAMVPVANVVLVIKELLLFKINYEMIGIIIVTNIAYSVFGILILGRLYRSEKVLFDEGRISVNLFEKRKNMEKGGVPLVGDAWFILMLVMVVFIYVGGLLQLRLGMIGLTLSQVLIIAGIPVLYALYTKRSIRDTFLIRRTGLKNYIGGFFLILGALFIGMIVTSLLGYLFPSEMENVNVGMEDYLNKGFWVTLLVVAFVPAVCEEMMFRGFVFSAMKRRYKPLIAILIVAITFGVYHMSIVRFFTTALLGAAICYTAYKSGSIFPGIIMHFTNNALSVIIYYHGEKIGKYIPFLLKEFYNAKEVFVILLLGAVFTVTGSLILGVKDGREKKQ